MDISMILSLLGGLALFLTGMRMMSDNLEAVAGERLKDWLEKLTSNRFLGVLVGAGITALIQSSSATTVMVVGFVNSGLMTLNQAVWIIMGANIGTTITGQLVALDIGAIAPLFAFIGVMLVMFFKKAKIQNLGNIIAGLGILFIGLGLMSDAMKPLRDYPAFINMLTSFSNPVFGILAGAAFTAVIQSSSASVGILQALAVSGLIDLHSAVYVLFGQNIGTCVTALIASIGSNRSAKRTTIIHMIFNVVGTAIFVALCMTTPLTQYVMDMVDSPAAQIANMHTIFNVGTTLLLLPFGNYMAKIATKILPDKKQDVSDDAWLEDIMSNRHMLGASAIIIKSLASEVDAMKKKAADNLLLSMDMVLTQNSSNFEKISKLEDSIDLDNVRISKRISKVMAVEHSLDDTKKLNELFKIIGNIERIGDHAMNIAEYSMTMKHKKFKFSSTTKKELEEMEIICKQAVTVLTMDMDKETLLKVALEIESKMDETAANFRTLQIERLNNHQCEVESAILYSELLVDYERIGDHILNIAQSYYKMAN